MNRRVVVTGLGLISPLGLTLEDNWDSLIKGNSGIDFVSHSDSSSWKFKVAGEVRDFKPDCLPGKKKQIKLMNRDSQLAVAATSLALEDSKLNRDGIDPSNIGVALGTFGIQYSVGEAFNWLKESMGAETLNPIFPLTLLPNMSLCHIAITHNIQGPNITFCSLTNAGAHSIGEAFKLIKYGEADIFIAGGCNSLNTSYLFALYTSGLLSDEKSSPSASCRPFDKRRSGLIMGEGAAVVILEELSHALRRNAPIYGEVIGYCSTMQGGETLLFENQSFETRVEGVAACLQNAIGQAEIDPEDVDYINADGKATFISDWVETEAIKKVFGSYAYHLSISSTKSMMGHLLCASAPAELIIGALVIREGVIPPTINYQHPDPCCDLDYTPNHFKRRKVKVVLSNTIGLSGENTALLLRRFS
jgi:3-oxoacyl-[acyl-carrier-protein] synthase II